MQYHKYVINALAKHVGHSLVRLYPYHCDLNPKEMVWSEVKGYVASQNTTFKLSDVGKHVYDAFHVITPEKWRDYISHIVKHEQEMWNLEVL